MYTLNTQQEHIRDEVYKFVHSDANSMIISGAGGVGKTYLVQYLIEHLLDSYTETCKVLGLRPKYKSVDLTATTNKAAQVLSESTGLMAQTIHTLLKLTVKNNFKTGKTSLAIVDPNYIVEDAIIFIDECSMIDYDLYEHINSRTHNCKFIYVGDHSQLPPVFEEISPIYRQTYEQQTLTIPVRNANKQALMELCSQVRDTVAGVRGFDPIKLCPGVIDWLNEDQVEEEIKRMFVDSQQDVRILAYTNKKVDAINKYIRNLKDLPEQFVVGEHIISNSAIRTDVYKLSVEEEFVITDVYPATKYKVSTVELPYYTVDLKNHYKTYYGVKIPVHSEAFNAVLKSLASAKDWSTYYFLKSMFADLRPKSACTIHKSQGSSYDTVIIDLSDLSTCNQPKLVARLLYVAVTRASNRIIFTGNLPSKYGVLIE